MVLRRLVEDRSSVFDILQYAHQLGFPLKKCHSKFLKPLGYEDLFDYVWDWLLKNSTKVNKGVQYEIRTRNNRGFKRSNREP